MFKRLMLMVLLLMARISAAAGWAGVPLPIDRAGVAWTNFQLIFPFENVDFDSQLPVDSLGSQESAKAVNDFVLAARSVQSGDRFVGACSLCASAVQYNFYHETLTAIEPQKCTLFALPGKEIFVFRSKSGDKLATIVVNTASSPFSVNMQALFDPFVESVTVASRGGKVENLDSGSFDLSRPVIPPVGGFKGVFLKTGNGFKSLSDEDSTKRFFQGLDLEVDSGCKKCSDFLDDALSQKAALVPMQSKNGRRIIKKALGLHPGTKVFLVSADTAMVLVKDVEPNYVGRASVKNGSIEKLFRNSPRNVLDRLAEDRDFKKTLSGL